MPLELLSEDTLLLIIDYQHRLAAAMPAEVLKIHAANVARLAKGAAVLDLPIIVTEQYPRGLGDTLDVVLEALPEGTVRHPKTQFSVWRDPNIRAAIEATGRRQVVMVGMETHVCVYQSARDLVAAGYEVCCPQDALVSRAKGNWRGGLRLLTEVGATVTVTEAVLFDLIKEGRGEAFKAISRLVR